MQAEVDAKIGLNLDTTFLKIIAVATMLCDHIGAILFPNIMLLRVIGRIAFPLFAYCMAVGVLYTKDFQKYITRLGIFAVISQFFWALAFHPEILTFAKFLSRSNIFFSLFFGAIFLYGMKEKAWLLIIAGAIFLLLFNFEYGSNMFLLLLCFHFLGKKPKECCALIALVLGLPILISIQGFAVLAVPFIYFKTNFNPHVNKYFFYAFYPTHLLVLWVVRYCL